MIGCHHSISEYLDDSLVYDSLHLSKNRICLRLAGKAGPFRSVTNEDSGLDKHSYQAKLATTHASELLGNLCCTDGWKWVCL